MGFRVARASRLIDEARPLKLHAILNEGTLRLTIGAPELRQAQLRDLVNMAAQPNVTIRIVRPEDGLHAAGAGQFVVLDFETVRSIGYVELIDGAAYLQDLTRCSPIRWCRRTSAERRSIPSSPWS